MKFSLIVGTLNRRKEIELCLNSLLEQTYNNFEIIVIDQSDNDDTKFFIENLSDDRIVYKKIIEKGLSRARNIGLRLSSGTHFCLIDDDASYDCNYLMYASQLLRKNPNIIISGYIFDNNYNRDFAYYNELLDQKELSKRMVMKTCPSAGLFFPRNVIENVGLFDELFGVGSVFGAAEETDLLFRCQKKGYSIYYNSNCKLSHPVSVSQNILPVSNKKIASYYYGIGAFYRKHIFYEKNYSLVPLYVEVLTKLIIKTMLFFRYDMKTTISFCLSFNKGFKDYRLYRNRKGMKESKKG